MAVQAGLLQVAPGESLQTALDASVSGDTVQLMPGVHQGTGGHLAVFTNLHNGILLLGDPEDPASVILEGGGLTGSILVLDGSAGTLDSTTAIAGVTFLSGDAGGEAFGGALFLDQASPTLYRCCFRECAADNGGAVFAWRGSPVLDSCLFEENSAESAGGAVFLYASDAFIANCEFDANFSSDDGGGIYCHHSSPQISNCAFTGGLAQDDGGGIYCFAFSHPEISFCTFTGNTAALTGSAVYFRTGSSPFLHDNIVSENTGPAFFIQDGGEPSFSHNCVWGNEGGDWGNLPDLTGSAGNISADPLLTGSLFLSQTAAGQAADSPCLDAGSMTALEAGLAWAFTRTDSVPDQLLADLGFHHGTHGWSHWAEQGNPHGSPCSIYPNPCPGSFTLIPPSGLLGGSVSLYELSGRCLWTTGYPPGTESLEIDALQTAGLYLIVVSTEAGRFHAMVTVTAPPDGSL
jgi:predicted outer membrane repeat protein